MKRRLLIAIVLSLCICCLCVQSFALSYDGGEFTQQAFYAVIPWSEMTYSTNWSTWRFAPYGSTYYRTPVEHGQDRDPSYAETFQYIAGWTYTDGDNPSVEQMDLYASQTYYSQPSQYYANYVNYDFNENTSVETNAQITLKCRNVHVTQTQWNALYNYCWAKFSGDALFDLIVDISFVGVNSTNDGLESRSIHFERQALTGNNDQWKVFPSWDAFTSKGLGTYANGYMIKEITMTFDCSTFKGIFSIGNLYYNNSILEPDIPIFEKEIIVEKEIVKEVPVEELNLFNWIIGPIENFFSIEFFPGITLGGILGAFVVILVVLALIKLWGS